MSDKVSLHLKSLCQFSYLPSFPDQLDSPLFHWWVGSLGPRLFPPEDLLSRPRREVETRRKGGPGDRRRPQQQKTRICRFSLINGNNGTILVISVSGTQVLLCWIPYFNPGGHQTKDNRSVSCQRTKGTLLCVGLRTSLSRVYVGLEDLSDNCVFDSR